jgi:hypothetical protein
MVLTRTAIGHYLSRQLGEGVEVVTAGRPLGRQVRGLAVCSGRVISYVLDAQARTLQIRNLFELSACCRVTA